jgi:hypothetical protein
MHSFDLPAIDGIRARPGLARAMDRFLIGSMTETAERFAALPAFDAASLDACRKGLAGELGIKAGPLVHPARVALTGKVGCSVGCSIYQSRPSACRAFVAGSTLCLEARAAAGIK